MGLAMPMMSSDATSCLVTHQQGIWQFFAAEEETVSAHTCPKLTLVGEKQIFRRVASAQSFHESLFDNLWVNLTRKMKGFLSLDNQKNLKMLRFCLRKGGKVQVVFSKQKLWLEIHRHWRCSMSKPSYWMGCLLVHSSLFLLSCKQFQCSLFKIVFIFV